jgi:hypothetical protein
MILFWQIQDMIATCFFSFTFDLSNLPIFVASHKYSNMQKPTLFFCFIALLTLSLGLNSCNKNDLEEAKLAEHTAEFAFPLFSTNLLLKDLMFKVLNDTLSGDTLLINADNTMTLYYTGDVAEKPALDIYKEYFQLIPIPFGKDTSFSNPIQTPAGLTVSKAVFKSGIIIFYLKNVRADTLSGYFEITQMEKNGQVFRYPFSNILPGKILQESYSLGGEKLFSKNDTITFKYVAYNKKGERVIVPGEPNLFQSNVTVINTNLIFSYLEGYWGFSKYDLTRDTIEIDINQTNLEGGVTIKNPQVTMQIANSWGFPTRGSIKYLSFIGRDGKEYPLKSTALDKGYVDFEYPSLAKGEIGQTKYTEVFMDENNSNIAEIFNSQPTRLIYQVNGISNANQDPTITGFITDNSTIKLGVRVELVLEGAAKNFGAEQTLDLDFGSYADLDSADIQEVEFKLVSENTTPITSDVQIYFRDENQRIVDSLFTGGAKPIMEAAPVNAAGISTGVKRTENFIPMSKARFDNIRKTKTAELKTSFTTANGGTQFVKLLANNSVTVKMGMKVKVKR